jgi:hypothetical protein
MRFGLKRFIALGALSLALCDHQAIALDVPSDDLELQKAIYFFQETEASRGEEYEGAVEWSQTSHDGAPAILAVARLPQQDVTISVTIYRNFDRMLPATHMVDISFTGDLASSPIRRILGIVRKVTESALGELLVANAVPVTDHQFWIALSNKSQQIEVQNLQLLRYGFWFDIPIQFRDRSRALLTLERGEAGAEVFETVMGAWESN